MAVRYLLRPLVLWWRYFPQLVALYLLGWLGRKGAIELAAYVGGASFLINPMAWIGERRIVVWLDKTRAELFSYFQPLETLWDAAMAVLRTAFGGATIPLLWLAVAGIVYGVSMPDWRSAARRVVGDRADSVFERAAAGRK